MFHLAKFVYGSATAILTPMIRLYLNSRARQGKEEQSRLGEREGFTNIARPTGQVIWFHCASVGESMAVLPTIQRLHETGAEVFILLTTGTVTSARLMSEKLPKNAVHQYLPFDRPAWIRRFLNHWRPSVAIWVESEFWPNTLFELKEQSIPTLLVNGRVSATAYRRWRLFPSLISGILECFNLCLAQTKQDAEYLRGLGAPDVEVHGNLKLGATTLTVDEPSLSSMTDILGDRPRWLLSSSHEGEERLAASVHRELAGKIPDLLTIIVPRHPSRGVEIESALKSAGSEKIALRSRGEMPTADTSVYIADTMGELGLFYRCCDIVLMGKSMISPGGGQNPYEPAQLGCAVLFGPNMGNFVELSEQLLSTGAAVQVTTIDDVRGTVASLLQDHRALQEQKQRALTYCADSVDLTEDLVDRIRMQLS